jgi:DNA polymerase elongation subunit (family B)
LDEIKRLKIFQKECEDKNDFEGVKNYKDQQEFFKLIINSIYGVFASKYFNIGNVILANNITARARLNIWFASRPLLGIQ